MENNYEKKINKLVDTYSVNRKCAEQALNNNNENYMDAAKFFRYMYDSNSRIDIGTQVAMYSEVVENQTFDKSELDYMLGPHKFPDNEIEEIIEYEKNRHVNRTRDLYDPKLSEDYKNCPECSSHYQEHIISKIL